MRCAHCRFMRLRRPPACGESSDRLEECEAPRPVALRRNVDQALLDERLEQLSIRVGDRLGRVEVETAREYGEALQQLLLIRREQIVGPRDRGLECPLPGVG